MTVELATKLLNLPPVRVLVVGDAMTDVDLHGRFERFAQESPHVPIFKINRREERPGGAGAVAAMVAALGGDVSLLAGRTTVKTRRWVDGIMVGRDDWQGVSASAPTSLDVVGDLVERVDAVLVADYGKGFCTRELLSHVISTAKDRQIPCIVDPARGRCWRDYLGATAIKCNSAEWEEADDLSDILFHKLIVTFGDCGMRMDQQDFSARPRRAVDVTGCGDMVLAAIGVCVGGGMSWEDACRVANCAAGLKVERRGAVPVSRSEVLGDLRDGDTTKLRVRSKHDDTSEHNPECRVGSPLQCQQ